MGENINNHLYLVKHLCPEYMENQSQTSVISKQVKFKKWAKYFNIPFTKQDIQIASEYKNKCSTLLSLGKCKLKLQGDNIIHIRI